MIVTGNQHIPWWGPTKPVTFACNFNNNGPICNLFAPLESSQSPLFKSLPSYPWLHTLDPSVEFL